MTDANDNVKKDTLTVSAAGRLQLNKSVDPGKVKKSLAPSRSKMVTVEVRRTRPLGLKEGAASDNRPEHPGRAMSFSARSDATEDDHLTQGERDARLRALKSAGDASRAPIAREPLRRLSIEPEAPPSGGAEAAVTESTVDAPPLQDAPPPVADAPPAAGFVPGPVESRKRTGIVVPKTRQVVISAAQRRDIVEPKKPVLQPRQQLTPAPSLPLKGQVRSAAPVEEDDSGKVDAKLSKARVVRDESRRSGKLTVTQALSMQEENAQRMRSLASIRRQREKARRGDHSQQREAEKIIREVILPETITVQELANRMAERAVDVVKMLMKMGTMVTVNQLIDADTAELITSEFGHKVKRVTEGDVENILKSDAQEDMELLKPRPPVVTIMGHVDHGKTSLLDALRKTDVVAHEAGGITQHIGAYQVALQNGEKITFLDTPGHEAFTAMRARGAKVTDIVVLVVAADDGIMEQTKEAISHAKAAAVPIIVAINKIDKPDADPQRVRTELMNHELVAEEFGGDVMVVEVSAKQGINLDKLQEAILLQAEVLDLKANPDRQAAGVVVEAKMVHGKGAVATLLVHKGTLRTGDIVVAGGAYGRIRALSDDKGRALDAALPGMPVEIQGLDMVPDAGDEFAVVENEKTARDITEYRKKRSKAAQAVVSARSLDQLFAASTLQTAVKELPMIVKADVHGSMEAIVGSLQKLSTEEVAVKVLHSGVGAINESDVTLAQTTGALIIGFNVRAGAKAKALADKEKINIRYYSIIYEVVDDVKAALSGMLSPSRKEKFLGYAEIRQVFDVSKFGKIAGCMVTEGLVRRGSHVRLLRDNVVIHDGALKTLRRFKDDVKEVKSGFECGIAFENYEDIRENDMIESYEIEETARTI